MKGEGCNNAECRFSNLAPSLRPTTSNVLLDRDTIAAKAMLGKEASKGPHDMAYSTRPQVRPFPLPVKAKDEPRPKTYNKAFKTWLGGLVAVAERESPAKMDWS